MKARCRMEEGMKTLILMALDKAGRLTDEELMEEIALLQSGKKKFRLRDERGRVMPSMK